MEKDCEFCDVCTCLLINSHTQENRKQKRGREFDVHDLDDLFSYRKKKVKTEPWEEAEERLDFLEDQLLLLLSSKTDFIGGVHDHNGHQYVETPKSESSTVENQWSFDYPWGKEEFVEGDHDHNGYYYVEPPLSETQRPFDYQWQTEEEVPQIQASDDLFMGNSTPMIPIKVEADPFDVVFHGLDEAQIESFYEYQFESLFYSFMSAYRNPFYSICHNQHWSLQSALPSPYVQYADEIPCASYSQMMDDIASGEYAYEETASNF